jgi:hypothetical protein
MSARVIDPAAGGADEPPEPQDDTDEDGPRLPDELSAPRAAAVLAFLDSQTKLAQDGASQNLAQVERSRKRTDLWGKGVLAVGTALLTALGIGKLADFLPQDGAINQILATLGLVVALAAVMIVGLRLSRVSLPIALRPNEDAMKKATTFWRRKSQDGLSRRELDIVGRVYDRFTSQNGIRGSLAQYAAIAMVIESAFTILADEGKSPTDIDPSEIKERTDAIADELDSRLRDGASDDLARAVPSRAAIGTYVEYAMKHPDLARAKAALVRAELRWVMTNALADIVGRRAVNATTDWFSLVILALVPIGVVASVAITYFGNANDANRLQDWQDSKTCVEVARSLKDAGLTLTPPECVFPAPTLTPATTPPAKRG